MRPASTSASKQRFTSCVVGRDPRASPSSQVRSQQIAVRSVGPRSRVHRLLLEHAVERDSAARGRRSSGPRSARSCFRIRNTSARSRRRSWRGLLGRTSASPGKSSPARAWIGIDETSVSQSRRVVGAVRLHLHRARRVRRRAPAPPGVVPVQDPPAGLDDLLRQALGPHAEAAPRVVEERRVVVLRRLLELQQAQDQLRGAAGRDARPGQVRGEQRRDRPRPCGPAARRPARTRRGRSGAGRSPRS